MLIACPPPGTWVTRKARDTGYAKRPNSTSHTGVGARHGASLLPIMFLLGSEIAPCAGVAVLRQGSRLASSCSR